MDVRLTNAQISNENIAETFVIVLAGVDGYMIAVRIEDLHHQAQPDDLGSRAEDRHYLHK
jgi:hypothetical protein